MLGAMFRRSEINSFSALRLLNHSKRLSIPFHSYGLRRSRNQVRPPDRRNKSVLRTWPYPQGRTAVHRICDQEEYRVQSLTPSVALIRYFLGRKLSHFSHDPSVKTIAWSIS